MDSGIGHETLNKFLSVVNVPPIFRNTMVRAQTRVGNPLASVAESACVEAIQEEKALQQEQDKRFVCASSYADCYVHCISRSCMFVTMSFVSLLLPQEPWRGMAVLMLWFRLPFSHAPITALTVQLFWSCINRVIFTSL